MNLRNVIITGAASLCAAAALGGTASAAQQPATLKADKCSLHVNIAHPHAGQRETLTVTSTAARTTVQVRIKYRTVSHTWRFVTPAGAKTTYQFGVGNPTKKYRVTLSGTVIAVPAHYKAGATCSTSFVPE
jgi:hypothetical protein